MAAPGRAARAFLLLLRLGLVASYPHGQVAESCGDMVPRHGHAPLPDPVHRLAVAQTTFTPGDQIEGTACTAGGSLCSQAEVHPAAAPRVATAIGAPVPRRSPHLFADATLLTPRPTSACGC